MMDYIKHITDFYELSKCNFELETIFVNEGPYEESPIVIIHLYSVNEVGNPKYNEYRIQVECHSNKYWFHYLGYKTMVTEINLEASQYLLLKVLKDIIEITGIKKDLLPEIRYKMKYN